MSNMVKLGVFEIQDTLYNSTTVIAKKFCKNNICVLGFRSPRLLIIDGVKYKGVVGFSIDANKKELQVNYGINNTVTSHLKVVNNVTVLKEGSIIKVTIV